MSKVEAALLLVQDRRRGAPHIIMAYLPKQIDETCDFARYDTPATGHPLACRRLRNISELRTAAPALTKGRKTPAEGGRNYPHFCNWSTTSMLCTRSSTSALILSCIRGREDRSYAVYCSSSCRRGAFSPSMFPCEAQDEIVVAFTFLPLSLLAAVMFVGARKMGVLNGATLLAQCLVRGVASP